MTTYINTYDIATQGHNSTSTYTFAVQGFYVYLEIETLTPTPTPTNTLTPTPTLTPTSTPTVTLTPTVTPEPTQGPEEGGGGVSGGYIPKGLAKPIRKREREKREDFNGEDHITPKTEDRKRVKVCVIINGEEYCKTKIVKNRPDLSVDDIDIQINDKTPKPKITIKINKK
jgi:hypothetical protein